MSNIILTDAEAKLLAQQDEITSLRVLVNQPPEGYEMEINTLLNTATFVNKNNETCFIPLRYPSGKYKVKGMDGQIEVETTVGKRDDGLWYEVIKGRKVK